VRDVLRFVSTLSADSALTRQKYIIYVNYRSVIKNSQGLSALAADAPVKAYITESERKKCNDI